MASLKKIIYLGMLTVLSAGIIFPAPDAKAATVEELRARIQELTRQLEALKKQLGTGAASVRLLVTDLRYGVKGSVEVRRLQQFLVGKGYLEKGLVTGNFFALTRDALRRFQQVNSLPATGVLDAKTRSTINGLLQKEAATEVDGKTLIVKTATSTPLIATSTSVTEVLVKTRPENRLDPRPVYDMTAIERTTFDMVNAERQKNGLRALIWNDQVAAVARAHSADQAGDNTAITDPDVACLYPFIRHEGFVAGFKAGDRLEQAGVPYQLAGENIIILPMTKELIYQAERPAPTCAQVSGAEGVPGETVEAARVRIENILKGRIALMVGQEALNWVNREWKGVQEMANESTIDWMNSPGHRHNILTPEFEETGMGAAVVNDYIIMTQVFLKRPAL